MRRFDKQLMPRLPLGSDIEVSTLLCWVPLGGWDKFDPNKLDTNSGQVGPESTKFGPNSTGVGPKLTSFGENPTGIGQYWPELDQRQPNIGRGSAESCPYSTKYDPKPAKIGQKSIPPGRTLQRSAPKSENKESRCHPSAFVEKTDVEGPRWLRTLHNGFLIELGVHGSNFRPNPNLERRFGRRPSCQSSGNTSAHTQSLCRRNGPK